MQTDDSLINDTLYELYAGSALPAYWFDPPTLEALATIRDDPARWGEIKAVARAQRINPFDLEKAVDACVQIVNALPPAPTARHETTRELLCPALPRLAQLPDTLGTDCAPWLDAYCHHSMQWSPRGIPAFHQAVGLWILSTIAARRIYIELGSAVYPVLFLAMVARSTLFAKTTTAKIGRDAIIQAGCGHLLSADRSTPQALLRSMSGAIPSKYGQLSEDAQERVRARLAFAAQRGWYFEEWGGMLEQMRRKDSPMSEFHGLLRVLDDGYDSFSSDTISRGLEEIESPYLSLLASATPHDLAPFMRTGSAWWHDGFWPRFALVCPSPEALPSIARRPLGSSKLPSSLVVALHDWHQALGIPTVSVQDIPDLKGKPSGEYRGEVSTLPQHGMDIAGVFEQYNIYGDSLVQILTNGDCPPDLYACYGRYADKALRVAMLLASMQGYDYVDMTHWAYAQRVTESWRLMLHQLIAQVQQDQPLAVQEILEERIERTLLREGPQTARNLQRLLHGGDSKTLQEVLKSMVAIGRIQMGSSAEPAEPGKRTRPKTLYFLDDIAEEVTHISDDEPPF